MARHHLQSYPLADSPSFIGNPHSGRNLSLCFFNDSGYVNSCLVAAWDGGLVVSGFCSNCPWGIGDLDGSLARARNSACSAWCDTNSDRLASGFGFLALHSIDLHTIWIEGANAAKQYNGEGMRPAENALRISDRMSIPGFRSWLQDWSELAKARLSLLVLLTTLVGLYCGAGGVLEPWRTFFTLLGTSLVAAAAATLNEWIERDLDLKMTRTAQRPLPAGRIRPDEALLGGAAMAGLGLATLYFGVHPPAALLAAVTLALYLFVYTPMKKWTAFNTLVGAIPGAIPPLIGFAAGRGRIEAEGWALFSILFFWQIPHFMAIAWRHREDYRKAGFRMLPCSDDKGRITGLVALIYCLALLVASIWPVALQAAGWIYAGGAILLGLGYTFLAGAFAWRPSMASARNLFLGSILYLPILLILLVADRK